MENSTAFGLSPRSNTLAIGTEDGRILWWDARTGQALGMPTTVGGSPIDVVFSPDGRQLAVSIGPVLLLDVATRKREGSGFPNEKGWVPGITFEPDGRLLIFGHTATTEWPTDLPTLWRAACRIAGRDLTPAAWRDVIPNRPYRHVCS